MYIERVIKAKWKICLKNCMSRSFLASSPQTKTTKTTTNLCSEFFLLLFFFYNFQFSFFCFVFFWYGGRVFFGVDVPTERTRRFFFSEKEERKQFFIAQYFDFISAFVLCFFASWIFSLYDLFKSSQSKSNICRDEIAELAWSESRPRDTSLSLKSIPGGAFAPSIHLITERQTFTWLLVFCWKGCRSCILVGKKLKKFNGKLRVRRVHKRKKKEKTKTRMVKAFPANYILAFRRSLSGERRGERRRQKYFCIYLTAFLE